MNIVRILKYKFSCNFILISLLFFLNSCNLCKYVADDELLLRKENIEILEHNNSINFSNDELFELLTQKPNLEILSNYNFHLRLYNLTSQKRIHKKIIKKQDKIDIVNKKINLKNEKILSVDSTLPIKTLKSRKLVLGERIRNKGEAPVIYSPLKSQRSKDQLKTFLFNRGFFNAKVLDSIFYLKKKKQIDLHYYVKLGNPTFLNSVNYKCDDKIISNHLETIKSTSIFKKEEIFDTDQLVIERNRINDFLRNKGFYFFNKEFIYFDIDSNNLDNRVNLTLGIQNYKILDSSINNFHELNHNQFIIEKVNVKIKSNRNIESNLNIDSISRPGIYINNYNPISFKKKIFQKSILLKKGDLYRQELAQNTYKRLISLGLFKYVSISFDTVANNSLISNIDLAPSKVQNFSFSVDGTNKDRLLGVLGSLNYTHNNLFHGGEKLLLSLKGSFEIQMLLTDNRQSGSSIRPNTTEFGPEFHFILPKYFLINSLGIVKNHINPSTEFTAAYNIQNRPDFYRKNQEFSFGWIFHERKKTTWHINPFLISLVDFKLDSSFKSLIDNLDNEYILASFQDHVVAGGVFSFEFNGQDLNQNSNSFYLKSTFESAGGSLFRFHELSNKEKNISSNSYDFLGIRYAHFQKLTIDLRYYHPISDRSKIVYRLYSGIGIPRKNLSQALPFEKSFFAGGSNSLRAWRARSLGPGSFYDSNQRYDKIGDIKFEGNVETRFPITELVEGALFVDFGNVWLMGFDSARPLGKFNWKNAIDDLAVGAGFGLRFNFEFFILRADLAIPIKNPGLPDNKNSWIFNSSRNLRKEFFPLQLNLGIGYPF